MAKRLSIVLGEDVTDKQVEALSALLQIVLTLAGINSPTFLEDEPESEGGDVSTSPR